MKSPLLAALSGKCPACRTGALNERFLLLHELCPACGVRFERYVGTRIVATVLSFGVGAGFAFGVHGVITGLGGDRLLMPLAVALAAVCYPLFRNLAVFLLWHNGLVTVDAEPAAPAAPAAPAVPVAAPPRAEPFGIATMPILSMLPPDDDPTAQEPRPLAHDEHTDERDR